MGLNLAPLLLLQVDSEAQQGRSLGLTRNSWPEPTSTISLQLEQIPSHSEEVIYAESKAQPEFIHYHLNNSHTYEHPHIPSASLPSLPPTLILPIPRQSTSAVNMWRGFATSTSKVGLPPLNQAPGNRQQPFLNMFIPYI